MRRDLDLIRRQLQGIELGMDYVADTWSTAERRYHSWLLESGGFVAQYADGENQLTWAGHELLARLRQEQGPLPGFEDE